MRRIFGPLLSSLLLAAQPVLSSEPRSPAPADDQRVSVLAREGDSLRTVLEDLCWREDVRFQYDAADEPLVADIRERPLAAVLEHLLRGKSYSLTLRKDPAGGTRVTGLHVLGLEGAWRWASTPSPAGFRLPQRMLETAFATPDTPARSLAIQDLVRSITSDPQQLRAFLATDIARLESALRQYPAAPQILRQIRDSSTDAAVKAKLSELLAALE